MNSEQPEGFGVAGFLPAMRSGAKRAQLEKGSSEVNKRQLVELTPLCFEEMEEEHCVKVQTKDATYFMEDDETLAWEATQVAEPTQEARKELIPSTQVAEAPAMKKPTAPVSAFHVMMKSSKQLQRSAPKNAFEKLMQGNKPKQFSKKKNNKRGKFNSFSPLPPSRCPFYKRIPGTPFIVDGFRFGSKELSENYVLTHFHSDHYGGLHRHWTAGTIYCTPVTAALVQTQLRVPSKYIRAVPFNQATTIAGTEVTFLDANHCPGAAMVLFRTKFGRVYLHVGDFRWCSAMKVMPPIRQHAGSLGTPKRFDAVYLDTTYCDPQYCFPKQEEVVEGVLELTKAHLQTHPGTLVLFGAYSIGKERVFMAVAKALGERLCVSKAKFRIMSQLDWDLSDMALLTTNPREARLHVVPMGHLTAKNLRSRLRDIQDQNVVTPVGSGSGGAGSGSLDAMWRDPNLVFSPASATSTPYLPKRPVPIERVVAFKPTGWTFSGGPGPGTSSDVQQGVPEHRGPVVSGYVTTRTGVRFSRQLSGSAGKQQRRALEGSGNPSAVTIYGVPYSEHSSFEELRDCVAFLDPLRVIPTVNCRSKADSDRMIRLLKGSEA